MRPRVFPAEDALEWIERECFNIASMRPRVFPAEDALDRLDPDLYGRMLQ